MAKSYGPGALLFGEEEKKELMDVIESGYLYRYGEEVDPDWKQKVYGFEQAVAIHVNRRYCVALNSGTSAIMTALAAAGIGPGDEVIVPGYTFIASIAAIVYARAIPILAEVDESLTIDPEDVKRKITDKTKAILPVHMIGNPADMDKIMEIAESHNLLVVEDACQAFGGSYKGQKLGSIGHIGCFSFNRFKTINSGDGGALVTNDKSIYERAFALHDQGHLPNRKGAEMGNRALIGLNFRMNELTAAVLLAQLRKTDFILDTLRKNKRILKNVLSQIPGVKFRRINDPEGECATILTLQFESSEAAEEFAAEIQSKTVFYSGWHVYTHMEQLLGQKVPTEYNCPFQCPVYGRKVEYTPGMLPQTEDLLKKCVSIGVGVIDKGNGASYGINVLSAEEEVRATAEKLADIIQKYTNSRI